MNNQASESRKEKNEHDEEITRLKAELEKERELRKELVKVMNEIAGRSKEKAKDL